MKDSPALSVEEHRSRARRHEKVGRALVEAGDEWGAVCLFYAAYHDVKAALLEDPVFDSLAACQAASPDLLPEDRNVQRHHGRTHTSNGREWGINELVLKLYRGAAGTYERLHQASISVRYKSGLSGPVSDVQETWEKFISLRDSGTLTWAPPADR